MFLEGGEIIGNGSTYRQVFRRGVTGEEFKLFNHVRLVGEATFIGHLRERWTGILLQDVQGTLHTHDAKKIFWSSTDIIGKDTAELLGAETSYIGKLQGVYLRMKIDFVQNSR